MTQNNNTRKWIDAFQSNCERMNGIADLCESEKREMTDAEKAEFASLERENSLLRMRVAAASAQALGGEKERRGDIARALRENIEAGRQTKFVFKRDLVMTGDVEPGGIIPIKVQDILEPLQEGLILDKVGLTIQSGLAGDYIWPLYEAVDAYVLGEGVALTDSPIKMDKLTAAPERIGVAIPVTRETINQTEGVVETIVRTVMPKAVTTLINKIMFSTTKIEKLTDGGSTTSETNLYGPFVDCKQTATLTELTFKSLNALKAQVLATGIDGNALCWVMTKANKAILEATPKDAGSGIMVCENDTVCGLPVFTTNFIGEDHIGLGDWTYQAMGLFGDMVFTVDPYSQARKNAVDFVINVNYGTKTLRPEAFLLATIEETDSGNDEP